jgi:hypothetical protein
MNWQREPFGIYRPQAELFGGRSDGKNLSSNPLRKLTDRKSSQRRKSVIDQGVFAN